MTLADGLTQHVSEMGESQITAKFLACLNGV